MNIVDFFKSIIPHKEVDEGQDLVRMQAKEAAKANFEALDISAFTEQFGRAIVLDSVLDNEDLKPILLKRLNIVRKPVIELNSKIKMQVDNFFTVLNMAVDVAHKSVTNQVPEGSTLRMNSRFTQIMEEFEFTCTKWVNSSDYRGFMRVDFDRYWNQFNRLAEKTDVLHYQNAAKQILSRLDRIRSIIDKIDVLESSRPTIGHDYDILANYIASDHLNIAICYSFLTEDEIRDLGNI